MLLGYARFYSIILALFTGSGLAIALYSQYYLDAMPCAWCILQRILFIIIFIASLISIFLKSRLALRIFAGFNVLLSLGGLGAVAYQWLVASQDSTACTLTWIEKMTDATGLSRYFPDVFGVYASCADAIAPLMGVPYPLWAGALFGMVTILSLAMVLRLKA